MNTPTKDVGTNLSRAPLGIIQTTKQDRNGV